MTGAPRILILGGGPWQLDLIRHAVGTGAEVIVADLDPQAPGKALVARSYDISTDDRDGLLAIARSCAVDLVLSDQSDRLVPVVGYLNEALGLPGILPEQARLFTDKLAMREALAGSGAPMPGYAEVASVAEAIEVAAGLGYPVVLKPKSSRASLGVVKCDTAEEVRHSFDRAMAVSADGRVLVEQFIDGTEITVEGLSVGGRFQVLAISEKSHYAGLPCVARKLAYPPRYDGATMARIEAVAATVVTTLGLQDGISHAEYRMRDGEPYLVEVAARGGGNRISSMINRHVSGIDTYDVLLRALLGEPVEPAASAYRAAILEFFDFAPGLVEAVDGMEELEDSGLAQDVALFFAAGDTLTDPTDDLTRQGYFITLGDTRDDVESRADRIKETVRVTTRS